MKYTRNIVIGIFLHSMHFLPIISMQNDNQDLIERCFANPSFRIGMMRSSSSDFFDSNRTTPFDESEFLDDMQSFTSDEAPVYSIPTDHHYALPSASRQSRINSNSPTQSIPLPPFQALTPENLKKHCKRYTKNFCSNIPLTDKQHEIISNSHTSTPPYLYNEFTNQLHGRPNAQPSIHEDTLERSTSTPVSMYSDSTLFSDLMSISCNPQTVHQQKLMYCLEELKKYSTKRSNLLKTDDLASINALIAQQLSHQQLQHELLSNNEAL